METGPPVRFRVGLSVSLNLRKYNQHKRIYNFVLNVSLPALSNISAIS